MAVLHQYGEEEDLTAQLFACMTGGSNPNPEDSRESTFLRCSVTDLKDLHLMHPPPSPKEPEPEAKEEEKVALPTTKPKSVGKPKWLRR